MALSRSQKLRFVPLCLPTNQSARLREPALVLPRCFELGPGISKRISWPRIGDSRTRTACGGDFAMSERDFRTNASEGADILSVERNRYRRAFWIALSATMVLAIAALILW